MNGEEMSVLFSYDEDSQLCKEEMDTFSSDSEDDEDGLLHYDYGLKHPIFRCEKGKCCFILGIAFFSSLILACLLFLVMVYVLKDSEVFRTVNVEAKSMCVENEIWGCFSESSPSVSVGRKIMRYCEDFGYKTKGVVEHRTVRNIHHSSFSVNINHGIERVIQVNCVCLKRRINMELLCSEENLK